MKFVFSFLLFYHFLVCVLLWLRCLIQDYQSLRKDFWVKPKKFKTWFYKVTEKTFNCKFNIKLERFVNDCSLKSLQRFIKDYNLTNLYRFVNDYSLESLQRFLSECSLESLQRDIVKIFKRVISVFHRYY